jgi:hypothetical protein
MNRWCVVRDRSTILGIGDNEAQAMEDAKSRNPDIDLTSAETSPEKPERLEALPCTESLCSQIENTGWNVPFRIEGGTICSVVECPYCGRPISEYFNELVPGLMDHGLWDTLSTFHQPSCLWILSRAHRIRPGMKFKQHRYVRRPEFEFQKGGLLHGFEPGCKDFQEISRTAQVQGIKITHEDELGVLPNGKHAIIGFTVTGEPFWIEC